MSAPDVLPGCSAGQWPAIKQQIAELRHDRRPWIGVAVVSVIFLLFAGGLLIILQPGLWAITGVPLLAQAMILSWYMGHECAHLLVFPKRQDNLLLGETLGWVNGGAFHPFNDFREDHIRHHAEQIDLVGIDVAELIHSLPRPVRIAVLTLESAYIPAVYTLIKVFGIAQALRGGGSGAVRAALAGVLFAAFYAAVFAFSPWALLLYFAAVCLRIHCVRFVDAFQHTYDHVPAENPGKEPDRLFEQHNTFSFPVARRFTFLNLLILNFGYHNAHHAVMTCPWYNLKKLDDVLGANSSNGALASGYAYDRHHVSFSTLLRRYHADRTSRITAGHSGTAYDAEAEMAFSMRRFSGAFTDNLLG